MMLEYSRVDELVYKYFLEWALKEYPNLKYEVIPIADRQNVYDGENGKGNVIARKHFGPYEMFEIKREIYEKSKHS